MESPKVPVSASDTHGVSRKHDVWARITSFWWQSWSYCPSTDGKVRATEPSLAWCSIVWDQAPRLGWGEKKKRQRPKKLANEASRLERGPFTLPNLPLWLASLSDFSAISLRFFPLSPTAEPGPRLGGASIVQVSSLTWWSLRVHPGTSRIT